eukprot:CAMPEP_0172727650 /NCGR_PEP_ID=MMETSP1074-20121228/91799_1 /TAXON_ID=2916 /ORGANISM="Ceratium fusus, Strain PA161109" /LENGTH=54 /DNA_ID=CAMNT_0013554823 /DNA_START=473 /DNA_END=637 /DNA_ORIENTATION=-
MAWNRKTIGCPTPPRMDPQLLLPLLSALCGRELACCDTVRKTHRPVWSQLASHV